MCLENELFKAVKCSFISLFPVPSKTIDIYFFQQIFVEKIQCVHFWSKSMKYTMNKIFKEVPKSEIGHKQIFRISVKKSVRAAMGLWK